MAGVYVLTDTGAKLQDHVAGDFWITGTWDSVDVLYVGY